MFVEFLSNTFGYSVPLENMIIKLTGSNPNSSPSFSLPFLSFSIIRRPSSHTHFSPIHPHFVLSAHRPGFTIIHQPTAHTSGVYQWSRLWWFGHVECKADTDWVRNLTEETSKENLADCIKVMSVCVCVCVCHWIWIWRTSFYFIVFNYRVSKIREPTVCIWLPTYSRCLNQFIVFGMYVPGRKLVSLIFIKFYFQVVPPCKEKTTTQF